jgi:hypothetical protein
MNSILTSGFYLTWTHKLKFNPPAKIGCHPILFSHQVLNSLATEEFGKVPSATDDALAKLPVG